MYLSILRFGMLLTLAAGVPAAAQPELFFAAGVDSTGWAQARSNADGHVLIESPQYPRGLWLHLVDDAGDALAGLQVEYQERPDRLVAIRCVDPAEKVRETLIWTRPEGDALRLTLQPKEAGDLPAGLASIDWQIAPSVEDLLEPVVEIRRIGWEAVTAFLKARWQSRAGRVAVQFNARTLAIEVKHPEDIETLVARLQQTQQPADAALGATNPLAMQIFAGNLGLQEGVILYVPLLYDPNLEGVVREALRRPQGRLTSEDFTFLTYLHAKNKDIRSLAGIEYFATLTWLELSGNQIADLTPISQLNSLRGLELNGNQIADLTPISQLKNLYDLNLSGNQVDDDALTLISQLNLQRLDLSGNQIADLTPISQLNSLEYLDLSGNRIVDLTPISQLKYLERLGLGGNPIVDLTPISQLKNLYALVLSDSRIADLTPISQLKHLRGLWLSGSQIDDDDLTLIGQLHLYDLDLSGNRIVDLTLINEIKYLQRLFLSNNRIEDVSPLAKLTYLRDLRLSTNRIEDISPLAELTGLRYLHLMSNPLSDQALTEQIPALEARGVFVSY